VATRIGPSARVEKAGALDAEFWGPVGRGCSHCNEGTPEEAFNWGKLCFHCIAGWFPGRSARWVSDWLIRQRRWFDRQVRRTPVKQLTLWGVR